MSNSKLSVQVTWFPQLSVHVTWFPQLSVRWRDFHNSLFRWRDFHNSLFRWRDFHKSVFGCCDLGDNDARLITSVSITILSYWSLHLYVFVNWLPSSYNSAKHNHDPIICLYLEVYGVCGKSCFVKCSVHSSLYIVEINPCVHCCQEENKTMVEFKGTLPLRSRNTSLESWNTELYYPVVKREQPNFMLDRKLTLINTPAFLAWEFVITWKKLISGEGLFLWKLTSFSKLTFLERENTRQVYKKLK